jgi:hypothetical protein
MYSASGLAKEWPTMRVLPERAGRRSLRRRRFLGVDMTMLLA